MEQFERFFTSEKKYFSIESFGKGYKALRAFKSIKDGETITREEQKEFSSLEEAQEWVNNV